ncbi:MAG TPA: lysophospholipase [Pasteurellaceae bacterium]|nr:lysophospholipase [Pasteurellaceae bacterium]
MQREPRFCQFALVELLPFAERFPMQYFSGKKNCRIAYRHFVHQQIDSRKLLVLANGRAENIMKWTEIAYDFYHRGYDVLAFDHRGQGYSQRLLSDPEKGHLDEFRFYCDDMADLIEKVTALYDYQHQHILAHSLGGLISTYYLANYDHHIESAVFSAPFYGIPMKYPVRDELIINLMVLFGQGSRYVFGRTAYKPTNLNNNELSSCKTRMKWMNRINRKFPEIHLGGPTFRWVHLCLNAINRLPSIISRIEIPVLILQSDKDKIVSNKNLENLTALFAKGTVEQVVNAKHEILFERDHLRDKMLQRISDYFLGKNPV